ncbi:pectinesterase family protein [Priestia megaterium]|uniref:pectinesterase family protein n=1 Tax=Priestia megaterium TaxID=1404 RepID=UPI001FB50BB3|nr:pectinesterase family protein [Priestia megaterium]
MRYRLPKNNWDVNFAEDYTKNLQDIDADFTNLIKRIANLIISASSGEIQANDARLDLLGILHDTLKERLDSDAAKVLTKADQYYVETMLAAAISGAPKGFYNTVTALQNAYPQGTEGVFLVLESGHIYIWNGTAWADAGVYQGIEVGDKTVSEGKTTFISSRYNMYNDNAIEAGSYYYKSGTKIIKGTGSNIATHPKIKLKANTKYTITEQNSSFWFIGDVNMNFIDQLSLGSGGGSYITTQDCYLYPSINLSLSHNTLMIVEGDRPSSFSPYGVIFERDIKNLLNYVSKLDLANYHPPDKSITEEKTSFVKKYYNMYDDTKVVVDRYYTSPSTTIINNSGTGTNLGNLPPIPLKANKKYSLSKYQSSYTFLADATGNKIAKLSDIVVNGSFTPTQDCYLYMTIATNLSHDTIMLVEGSLPATFKPYNVIYKRGIDNLTDYASIEEFKAYVAGSGLIKYTDIHVSQDGTQDFTTVSAAVNSLTDRTFDDQVNIYIHNGIYNEIIPKVMPSYVNLIGYSGVRENVVINGFLPNTANDADITAKSTIDLQKSNTLKNLTITARNMRYVIHSESANYYKDWTQILDNCHLEHYGNQDVIDYRIANNLDYSGVWSSPGAWVEGASSGAFAKFTRCKFIANASGGAAWSVHNNTNFTKPMLHILEDCELISKKYGSIKCEGLASGQNDKVYIKNCFLEGNIYCTNTLSIQCLVSGSTHVTSSTTTYFAKNSSALYTEYTRRLLNNTGTTIPAGTLVCYDGDNTKIRKMLSSDSAYIFAGYTIGDTPSGELATVITNGFYRYVVSDAFGTAYGVDNGALSATATNKIGIYVGKGFAKVKNSYLT